MEVHKNILDYFLVAIQLILLVLYFYQPAFLDPSLNSIFKVIGSVPMVLGAIIAIWGSFQIASFISIFPTPAKGGRLVTSGAFRLVRHPIYSGIILASFGYALYSMTLVKLLIAVVLLLFFELKSSYEERQLFKQYPEYAEYALKTGKFIPLWGLKGNQTDTEQYLHQDEEQDDESA